MKLEFLTDDSDLIAICNAYWTVNSMGRFAQTVTAIAKAYGMRASEVTQVAKQYCRAQSLVTTCSSCGVGYCFESRMDYTGHNEYTMWTCSTCVYEQESAVVATKTNMIAEAAVQRFNEPVNLRNLTPRQIIFLAALLRFNANEDFSLILSHCNNRTDRLTPYSSYDLAVMRELQAEGLIVVSPTSNVEYIELHEKGGFSFYMTKVEWLLCANNPVEFATDLENYLVSVDFRQSSLNELQLLAAEISLEECLFFLDYALAQHHLHYSPGDKTILVLTKGLENHSVAEMYNFIWKSAEEAAAYYVRERISKDHAAKSIVGKIENRIERSAANEWIVFPYRRRFNNKQSVLSRVLFNSVLGTDDGGFTTKISSLFSIESAQEEVVA